MSVLHAILLFGGVPFLICAAVVAFVMVPSMIRGPRYRPGQQWTAEPELIGSGQDADPAKQLPSGSGQGEGAGSGRSPGDSTGGASVKW